MHAESSPKLAAETETAARRSADAWARPPSVRTKTVALGVAIVLLLVWSGRRVEIDRLTALVADSVSAGFSETRTTQVGRGLHRVTSELFPIQLSETTPIDRMEGFDRNRLPLLSRLETRTEEDVRLDPATLKTVRTQVSTEVLVEPLGYLGRVLVKLLESLEMGLWGTLLALVLSAPLAVLAARNYAPHPALRVAARSCISFFRAVPELVSALFLVIAFGFGPIPGILALAFHASGFLGKFYAEDIENAQPGPQEALRCLGVSKLRILLHAVLPEVWPQYIAYTLYILDRNVRMATVIGIVGAGGIGQELKGRYEMFNYGHVGTILVTLFATVLLLDLLSSRLRARVL